MGAQSWNSSDDWIRATLQRMLALFARILSWRCYRPRVSYKYPQIHDISHVLLLEQHLQRRGGCTKIRYKRYKRATQTYFSYTNFYPTTVSNPTYGLPICFGLVHLIKSYDCRVNFIMTAITMNHLDRPIYYNAIVKLVALMSLKGIHHWSG